MSHMARTEIVALLGRTGHADLIPRAAAELPAVVDFERDAVLISSFYVTQESLMDDLGSSS